MPLLVIMRNLNDNSTYVITNQTNVKDTLKCRELVLYLINLVTRCNSLQSVHT